MAVVLWFYHMPRYFLGHLFGHLALLIQWTEMALHGLSLAMVDVSRSLCDCEDDEDSVYDDGSDDMDDDEGLPS